MNSWSTLNPEELSSLLSMGAGAASTAIAFLFFKNPFVSSTRARLERIESQISMIIEKVDHIIGVEENRARKRSHITTRHSPSHLRATTRTKGPNTPFRRYPYASSRSPSAEDRSNSRR